MIEEADFQEIGNAAIDLCVFVDKLCLREKHRAEADKLTHNVLNLIKQTGKMKEKEPLTKGNKMSKKLKIQFWKAERALAMQILEQEGLPKEKEKGYIRIVLQPELLTRALYLRGKEHEYNLCIPLIDFNTNSERDAYLDKVVNAITDELFTGKGELKIGEVCVISNDPQFLDYYTGKLIAILPKGLKNRYIIESAWDTNRWVCGEYVRTFNRTERPTIEECGQLITYTWEEK